MSLERADLSEPRHDAKVLIQNVSKQFGSGVTAVKALQSIDLAIMPRDFLCLVGPSGCGKSTLLNIVAGFESASTGGVKLDGKPVEGPGPERGVVFQQGALFNWMSVVENVEFGPLARGVSPAKARTLALEHVEMVGLSGFQDRYPYELSGGMQQRVGIARALANNPEVLLMDEPFAALDQQTRELLQEELKRIWSRSGKTVLWITHSIERGSVPGDACSGDDGAPRPDQGELSLVVPRRPRSAGDDERCFQRGQADDRRVASR